jgi:outer membrane protein assembly factor BamB
MAGLDLLIAGKTVLAFSKAGQKQWEGKLSFSIAPQHVEEARQAPALEAAGKLYVFDQGALTAFDARDGAVKWRVQSVGIRKVAQDARGGLYMVTTTAGADQIEASRNIGPGSKINTLLMKLDGASGAILWQAPGLADDVLLSGKMVYAARGRVSGVDLFSAASSGGLDAAAPVHHRIYRIDPKNGREKWEYYRPLAPSHIEPKSNFILLQYPAEVQVLKFMAL